MPASELVQEAKQGLSEYRDWLVEASAGYKGAVDTEAVRTTLRVEGLVTTTPLLTLPYQQQVLGEVVTRQARYPWREPFVAQRLEKALAMREQLDDGGSIYKVGFPTCFYSPLIDVAVVFDDMQVNEESFGPLYALGAAITKTAHEITHSTFANLSTKHFRRYDPRTVKVKQKVGACQDGVTYTMRRDDSTVPTYNPCWIDEAFADYMAAEVRAIMAPQTIPQHPHTLSPPGQNIQLEVPPKYLIFSEDYPDQPGGSSGSNGVGIDILAEKRPGLIPRLKALSTGSLALEIFHGYLKDSIGAELSAEITEYRPYSNWGKIYEAICDLA